MAAQQQQQRQQQEKEEEKEAAAAAQQQQQQSIGRGGGRGGAEQRTPHDEINNCWYCTGPLTTWKGQGKIALHLWLSAGIIQYWPGVLGECWESRKAKAQLGAAIE